MGALAPWHWAVLIIVVLLLFGGRLLPRLGKSLGRSLTGLKQGAKEGTEEFKSAITEKPEADKADGDAKTDEKGAPPAGS